MLVTECADLSLCLVGFEFLFDKNFMDREPSDYEIGLIEQLPAHPVQYRNIHFFKADG